MDRVPQDGGEEWGTPDGEVSYSDWCGCVFWPRQRYLLENLPCFRRHRIGEEVNEGRGEWFENERLDVGRMGENIVPNYLPAIGRRRVAFLGPDRYGQRSALGGGEPSIDSPHVEFEQRSGPWLDGYVEVLPQLWGFQRKVPPGLAYPCEEQRSGFLIKARKVGVRW